MSEPTQLKSTSIMRWIAIGLFVIVIIAGLASAFSGQSGTSSTGSSAPSQSNMF